MNIEDLIDNLHVIHAINGINDEEVATIKKKIMAEKIDEAKEPMPVDYASRLMLQVTPDKRDKVLLQIKAITDNFISFRNYLITEMNDTLANSDHPFNATVQDGIAPVLYLLSSSICKALTTVHNSLNKLGIDIAKPKESEDEKLNNMDAEAMQCIEKILQDIKQFKDKYL